MKHHIYMEDLWEAKLGHQMTATTFRVGEALANRAANRVLLPWQGWPTRAEVAITVGCCPATVTTSVARLRALGLIPLFAQGKVAMNRDTL